MTKEKLHIDPDRLFSVNPNQRALSRALYDSVRECPIISPHGHTDPRWFAYNENFTNATELLLTPDHYLLRMLYSQGIPLGKLGVSTNDLASSTPPRESWRIFAEHFYLFRGTPSQLWLNQIFSQVFKLEKKLSPKTADIYYDTITDALQSPQMRPRQLLDQFNVEFIATTEGATESLEHHDRIIKDGLGHRVTTTFRPDDVTDPDNVHFVKNIEKLGAITGEDSSSWSGYLKSLSKRRLEFKERGATATDHGHPTAATQNLSAKDAQQLYDKCLQGEASSHEKETFRGQMLTEMAKMSLEDGLVMQIHPGSYRNHNSILFKAFGADKGADIPERVSYTQALKPLLDVVGNEPSFKLILFTLDETNYARELAPLAGHYPCLLLGPPWWFHDSPEGMIRFRRQVTETAGFYNTAGFNDDTRAIFSIPARHDLARRMDSRFLAELVSEGRLDENEAFDLIVDLTVNLVKKAYNLNENSNVSYAAAE